MLEIEGNDPDLFTPFEGHIYANCQGTLCKWNETNFEPATEDEGQKLNGITTFLRLISPISAAGQNAE